MYAEIKEEMLKCAMRMDHYGLIALSGGNVSVRMENGDVVVTPSGMIYDEMVPDDMLVVDPQ